MSRVVPSKKKTKVPERKNAVSIFLENAHIKNFRGIKDLSLNFTETTVLIGENNTAKSSILEAIQICLSRTLRGKGQVFSEYDYHLRDKSSQPVDSDSIEITLRFVERKEGEWPDEVVQMLTDAVQVDGDGIQSITLRTTSLYDETISDFVTNWDFLDLAGNPLPKAKQPRYLIQLQQLVPVFYLAALRDAAQEFRPRSQFWGPFVRSLKIEPKLRDELEQTLSEINQRILDAHTSFDTVKERLKKTSDLVPLDTNDPVGIEAIPGKVFDMLSRTQVLLTSKTGARLPIGRHGEGTQSLAVICLFDAFLQSQLEGRYDKFSSPLLELEEPEAHLHPSAIRSVGKMLQDLNGQKVISTHSGDLISAVPLTSLRRLRRTNGIITAHQVREGALSPDEISKLNYHVRESRGKLVFARCWLLVEGEADWVIYSECGRILGHDLVSKGVYCVEQRGVGVDELIKLADQLGIEWIIAADNDQQGQKDIKVAESHLGKRPRQRHIYMLAHGDMEVYLCMEGFGSFFEQNVSSQKKGSITAQKGTLQYWQQVIDAQQRSSKPRNAFAVITEIEKKGKPVIPQQIQQILNTALELAKEAT